MLFLNYSSGRILTAFGEKNNVGVQISLEIYKIYGNLQSLPGMRMCAFVPSRLV